MVVAAIGRRVGSSVDNVVVMARQAVIGARIRLRKSTRYALWNTHEHAAKDADAASSDCNAGAATWAPQNWSGRRQLVSDWSCDNDARWAPNILARTVAGQWRQGSSALSECYRTLSKVTVDTIF
ncbi:hypothetical protein XAUC_21970 [Xanthomonas citri pv. aurantifolii str. ICPB 10535]|nr:hypothetical protein XAUC_21970 [Xanthomonas citri pv. aurantifolii str. ICPB 10535]